MANIYVRSTDGSDTDSGATWALAKATLAGAAAIDAVGDTIFFSQSHAESSAMGTIALAGTNASPTRLICANDAAEPPTSQANTATITSTGNITFSGALVAEGITFVAGFGSSGTVSTNFSGSTGATAVLQDCVIHIASTSSASRIDFTTGPGSYANFLDVDVKFAHAGQGIRPQSGAVIRWDGGSLLSGGTSPTTFMLPTGSAGANVVISAFDLSNASAGINLVAAGTPTRSIWRNCKLPASWSGAFVTGTPLNAIERHEFHNCDSAGTNYRLHIRDFAGTLDSETTLVRSGGATDGTTPISWKIVTNGNTKERTPFITPEFGQWGDTTGTSRTVSVEILHDSTTDLTDADIWLEVLYLGTAGSTLGAIASGARTNVLGGTTAHASSSATWTTTGMTNPKKQTLSLTFTPQMAGVYACRVKVGDASYTVYVDNEATVT